MNEQILFRLRDVLRRTGLSHEQSASLILLLLVWLCRAARFAHASLDLAPQHIVDALKRVSKDHPVLAHEFFDSQILRQISPVDLTLMVELANQLLVSSPGRAPNSDAVALPFLLDVSWACDPSLPRLIGRLVRPSKGELVYVPWDSTGQFGAALADLGARIVIETPAQPVIATLIGMLHHDQWQVDQVNPILARSTPGQLEAEQTYNSAATFLPLGMKIDMQWLDLASPRRFPEKTSSAAVLGIRQLLAVTKRRIVVAVQNNVLFSSGAEYSLREDLLRRGLLRAVIAMPAGLLQGAQVAFSVLVIEPEGGADRVHFVNADTQRFKSPTSRNRATLINLDDLVKMSAGEIDGAEVVSVPVRVLLDKDAQLQVNRYVLPESVARARALLASARTIPLEDFVTLVRPAALSGDREPPSDGGLTVKEIEAEYNLPPAFEVGAADLPEFGYITKPGRQVKVDPSARSADQYLRPYDIVLIVKGSVGKVGIVPAVLPDRGRWVAGQSAIVLRVQPFSRIDPRALFAQLRSPLGQEMLSGIVSGATIQLIQLKELRKLAVIAADGDTADLAICALDEEALFEEQIQALRQQQAELKNTVWQLT